MADDNVMVGGVPLPDARLGHAFAMRKRSEVVLNGTVFERAYCVNCGVSQGLVTKGSPVFAVCDACVGTWGPPPGAIEVPESWFQGD